MIYKSNYLHKLRFDAGVAEMADALGSGLSPLRRVGVQLPSPADSTQNLNQLDNLMLIIS